jgi:hypothetical protein
MELHLFLDFNHMTMSEDIYILMQIVSFVFFIIVIVTYFRMASNVSKIKKLIRGQGFDIDQLELLIKDELFKGKKEAAKELMLKQACLIRDQNWGVDYKAKMLQEIAIRITDMGFEVPTPIIDFIQKHFPQSKA